MTKKINQIFSLLLIFSLIILIFPMTTINVAAKKSTDDKKIIELGFSSEEINDFTVYEIEYFSTNDLKLVSSYEKYFNVITDEKGNVKYVEVDKETAIRESEKANKKEKELRDSKMILNEGTVTTKSIGDTWYNITNNSWMHLYGSVYQSTSTKYLFRMSWDWLTMPNMKLVDVAAITHSDSWSINPGTFYANNMVDVRDVDTGYLIETDIEEYYTPSASNINGQAIRFPVTNAIIYEPNYDYLDNIRGRIQYEVTKGDSGMIYSNMYGDYSHQILPGFFSIGLNLGNLSVSPSSSYSEANTVNVQFPVQ